MKHSSTFTQEPVLGEGLAVVPSPCRKVGVGVCLDIPEIVSGRLLLFGLINETYASMYLAVGKSFGSHPILRALEGW